MEEELPHKIRRLSKDFNRDISNDGAKRIMIPGKIFLECLLVWPDREMKYITVFNWFMFINVIIFEITHACFVVPNIADYTTVIAVLVTVTATFQFLVKFYVIVFKKSIINQILLNIWREYWPLSVLSPKKVKRHSSTCKVKLRLILGCYTLAVIFAAIITFAPFLTNTELIVKSIFPFQWNKTYTYELVYTWQFVTAWYITFLINSFDMLMISVVIISAVQFAVLQNVVKNILTEKGERQRRYLYNKDISNQDMFKRWLEQQRMLIDTCNKLEEAFRIPILHQLFCSITGLCASSVILKVDQSKFLEMSTIALANMFQLFYYCFASNELTLQSEKTSDAVYFCNWQISQDMKFKKALVLVLQRCQKPLSLTAAGFIDLNFLSYIAVLRLCFSFYTLLTDLIVSKLEAAELQ
uniref:Odorant receptor n=1 Tax=Anomala corpulenta TaxID=931571 RepID=A0A0E3Y6R0_9SCAR|nr:odorant receptor 25 [Anomala corpulenta]